MKKCILVVEDDFELRETVCEVLKDEGYDIKAAGSGNEALSVLKTIPVPALIMLDLMMPDMSGWEFRNLQSQDPSISSIPVLVVTAGRNLEDHPIDANEILYKPLMLDTLLTTVRRLLGEA